VFKSAISITFIKMQQQGSDTDAGFCNPPEPYREEKLKKSYNRV